jgi:DNA gyrase/topoisomerase IV subunit A
MGKIAAGVTVISLKEDDEVIYGSLLKNGKYLMRNIILKSSKNNEKIININDIKSQNRAGRGKSIMIIVMDDYIKKIELK